MKHPLTRALRSSGLDVADVAARLAVDPKTVQRWLAGRVPYPRHRQALAEMTGWPAHDLWPDVVRRGEPEPAPDEVRLIYPHRSAVPPDAWRRHFAHARWEVGVLAYSGLFLAEDAVLQRLLATKANAGVRVRVLLGDPDGTQVGQRGDDEGIDGAMTARIRNALVLCRSLATAPGVELRLHDTVLYNSIYRADDDVFVNPHVYGCPAAHAPTLLLSRTNDDGMATLYLESFERVWSTARPYETGE